VHGGEDERRETGWWGSRSKGESREIYMRDGSNCRVVVGLVMVVVRAASVLMTTGAGGCYKRRTYWALASLWVAVTLECVCERPRAMRVPGSEI
jgi:hypothetical protein